MSQSSKLLAQNIILNNSVYIDARKKSSKRFQVNVWFDKLIKTVIRLQYNLDFYIYKDNNIQF